MTYVFRPVNRQSFMERLIQDLSLESYRYRTIPLKHAHSAPAASIARVRLRNFCIRKRPSFLASRRFAPGYSDTFLTHFGLIFSTIAHFLAEFLYLQSDPVPHFLYLPEPFFMVSGEFRRIFKRPVKPCSDAGEQGTLL